MGRQEHRAGGGALPPMVSLGRGNRGAGGRNPGRGLDQVGPGQGSWCRGAQPGRDGSGGGGCRPWLLCRDTEPRSPLPGVHQPLGAPCPACTGIGGTLFHALPLLKCPLGTSPQAAPFSELLCAKEGGL